MSDVVHAGPMPPVNAVFECGPQRLKAQGVRCGLIVLPKGPEGTVQMNMQVSGTDRDVVVMALAVVEYTRSLGLAPALIAALESVEEIDGDVSVVRAETWEAPPTPPEEP